MQVTDLQGQSWPAVWKRAVFAVGFRCFGLPRFARFVCGSGAGVFAVGFAPAPGMSGFGGKADALA